MLESSVTINGTAVRIITLNTVVVGSGAAGFNAADRLFDLEVTDLAIVTEGVNLGTSRNTGSDKQTYYKLTLSGKEPDSVMQMAETLFQGGAVDGEHALCEAALSTRCFMKLVELGVPFPQNKYGEFVGYKTDHDPRTRATSVGPYTSRKMTEQLELSVRKKGIRIFDHCQVLKILQQNGQVIGLLCLDLLNSADPDKRYLLFNCQQIVYAVGGPACLYQNSVYPLGHTGASGVAFACGAKGRNLTEWQYGLASVTPRWNVSGTYMQVLPSFYSVDPAEGQRHDFLVDFFGDLKKVLDLTFLKGYQWPFDVSKVIHGSSMIDLLVWIETQKGRRVFLDFRQNPGGGAIDFAIVSDETRDYLSHAGACFGTPIERLKHMNQPAVDFYRDRKVDLEQEPLEIALCAQHNNGGLQVDEWWQTTVKGLFAVGEAACTHGIYRPGGTALNAGQVGSTRAALYIAARGKKNCLPEADFVNLAMTETTAAIDEIQGALNQDTGNVAGLTEQLRKSMSQVGAAIRNEAAIAAALADRWDLYKHFSRRVSMRSPSEIRRYCQLKDMVIAQIVYLSAMLDYIQSGGASRGSALYSDPAGDKAYDRLPEILRFKLDDGSRSRQTQEIRFDADQCVCAWRAVHPIPAVDNFFENVWRAYRENKNID